MTIQPSILVLAGRRRATLDPLAEKFGVSHKCLVPVAGEAMVGRVLRIAAEAFPETPLFLSVEDFAIVAGEPTVQRLTAEGRLTPVASAYNIVDSVVKASRTTGFPLLITTADNVLMTAEVLHAVAAKGGEPGIDGVVVMAREEDILAAHPDGQRRFYRFRDGGYSNCNLFWLSSARALGFTESFRLGGQFVKKKARAVRALGLASLLIYVSRLGTLDFMVRHFSRRFGLRMVALVARDGRTAIDVDNERTQKVAEEILARDGA
jgi:GTP:adenosylcobinamide-phosphate guanylyltransferase